jgi:alkylhydroperoxidase/carboxymuconolactone decarboxylase family protein YurZ
MREAVILAILCARGMNREFEHHALAALNLGMTKQEIQELILVCAYYAGAPHAVGATRASLDAFKKRGI